MNYQSTYFGFGNTNTNTNYTSNNNNNVNTNVNASSNVAANTKRMYNFEQVVIKQRLSYIKTRDEVSCVTKFSKTISMRNPFVVVSGNCETVIDTNTAGGIGIVAKMSLEDQIKNVKRIKDYIKLIDDKPVTVYSTVAYRELLDIFKDLTIDYVFVLSTNSVCIGMITRSVMELVKLSNYENFSGYAFDVMIPIDNIRCFRLCDYDWKNLVTYTSIQMKQLLDEFKTNQIIPILCDNKKLLGVVTLQNVLKFYKHRSECLVDEFGKLLAAVCIGVSANYMARVDELVKVGVSILYVSAESAYNNVLQVMVKEIKTKYPSVTVIVGYVQCADGYKYLCESGVDAVVINQMSGQFTVLQESYNLYATYNVPIISSVDTGQLNASNPQNDVYFKSLVAGGSSVMIYSDTFGKTELETCVKRIKNCMIAVNSKTLDELMATQPHYYVNS